ncbi:MBL fold metallo-hydrolase [Mechercharimyces sp. CAU 1602]|uniref:MBL fold metallo-hydrolase n=1 Tax=Mechercharimyces sp. CAU 1602 TaxID=2973933 RepID=UPI00216389C1|nr:MBL fold metallo-hydrolase [Mechercharimyces sp. CAU 1602]MCS1351938.1 MBL fold metallo-hydrolase [Mechercharimyces sp. CAU 1602]
MLKQTIADGIYLYQFAPNPGGHFGFNILALTHEDKALLIDTAFEDHAHQVFTDLIKNDLKLDSVVISHFHPDHISGLKSLPPVPRYGHANAQITLDKWTAKEEHPHIVPTFEIGEKTKIQFGNFELVMIPLPGHSICTMIIDINGQFVHVADEIMTSNDGSPILPFITNTVQSHVKSLEALKHYCDYTMILGHGILLKGREKILTEINDRLSYLNELLAHDSKISVEVATAKCSCTFLHLELHEKNA